MAERGSLEKALRDAGLPATPEGIYALETLARKMGLGQDSKGGRHRTVFEADGVTPVKRPDGTTLMEWVPGTRDLTGKEWRTAGHRYRKVKSRVSTPAPVHTDAEGKRVSYETAKRTVMARLGFTTDRQYVKWEQTQRKAQLRARVDALAGMVDATPEAPDDEAQAL